MSDSEEYLPFSQREGLVPIPPQLKLGEVSEELRRLLEYYFNGEIIRGSNYWGNDRLCCFKESHNKLARDFYVKFLSLSIENFSYDPKGIDEALRKALGELDFAALFDLVEFFVRHSATTTQFKSDLKNAFTEARAAYRIIDSKIVAIGTGEQGKAYVRAVANTEQSNVPSARTHLLEAGEKLRRGDWAGSVRESIHSVEATAVKLAPNTDTLGKALQVIEKKQHLHGALKSAFGQLYGYSSDEEGVRHALVLDGKPNVTEADALFMLGACASFVSYLLAVVPTE